MVFSSAVFLFLFLPIFLGVYYLTPWRFKSALILLGSYVFYAWWRVDFSLLFFGVTVWSYLIAGRITQTLDTPRAKVWVTIGVAGNLLTLFYFKYFNFGVDSLNTALLAFNITPWTALHVILPIGISFYIFHAISFIVDVYRKDAGMPKSFFDFAAFIALFPQLVAGPILRYKDLAAQFDYRPHRADLFSLGAYRFMGGFVKKVLIADTIAPLADAAFALENPSFTDAWLGALAYTVQLYFDFSGYSDMAIGLALMMGFRFPENFMHPYLSGSITEFWRRWHISLSTWLRDYLYIPLGGNRKGVARTYFNLWITMVLGGIWHGAQWTFVVWGLWHGTLLAIERGLGITGAPDAPRPLRVRLPTIALTTFLAILGWVMFRAPNVGTAFDFYTAMFGAKGFSGVSDAFVWQIKSVSLIALLGGIAVLYMHPFITRRQNISLPVQGLTPDHITQRPIWAQGLMMLVFLLAVSRLLSNSYSPFLYFQF